MAGEVTVMHIDDFENHRCETFYQIREEKTGEIFELKFGGKAPRGLATGMKVRARGKSKNSEFVLAEGDESIQTVSEPPVAALVSGERRALVMVLNFLDRTNSCTPASVNSLMFGATNSVKGLFNETSYGNVNITGNVVGPFTLNYNAANSCDYNAWASAADAAAQASGVNLSLYTNKVYVLPSGTGCTWGADLVRSAEPWARPGSPPADAPRCMLTNSVTT